MHLIKHVLILFFLLNYIVEFSQSKNSSIKVRQTKDLVDLVGTWVFDEFIDGEGCDDIAPFDSLMFNSDMTCHLMLNFDEEFYDLRGSYNLNGNDLEIVGYKENINRVKKKDIVRLVELTDKTLIFSLGFEECLNRKVKYLRKE